MSTSSAILSGPGVNGTDRVSLLGYLYVCDFLLNKGLNLCYNYVILVVVPCRLTVPALRTLRHPSPHIKTSWFCKLSINQSVCGGWPKARGMLLQLRGLHFNDTFHRIMLYTVVNPKKRVFR